MKNYVYLLIAPMLFSMASCGSNLPPRKSGQFVNVTFSSEVVTSDCPVYAPIGRNLQIHLDIPYVTYAGTQWDKKPSKTEEGVLTYPNIEYTVNVENIHVFIAGKEYPNAFTYFKQSDGYNVLTIRKEYVVNDIEINVTAGQRPFLYLFGFELGEELDKRRADYKGDDKTGNDLIVMFSRNYQNKKYPIKTLSGQEAYPVFEHDSIDVTFKLEDEGPEQLPLPDDLRFRCNARYGMEGKDYEREYSLAFYSTNPQQPGMGYRQCHFHIPYKIVNDHGSFRQYGTE